MEMEMLAQSKPWISGTRWFEFNPVDFFQLSSCLGTLVAVMEYVGPEKRTLVGNVPLAIFLTLGFVTLPWIAYGMADWRLFSIVTSAPLAVVLVMI